MDEFKALAASETSPVEARAALLAKYRAKGARGGHGAGGGAIGASRVLRSTPSPGPGPREDGHSDPRKAKASIGVMGVMGHWHVREIVCCLGNSWPGYPVRTPRLHSRAALCLLYYGGYSMVQACVSLQRPRSIDESDAEGEEKAERDDVVLALLMMSQDVCRGKPGQQVRRSWRLNTLVCCTLEDLQKHRLVNLIFFTM